MKPRDDAEAQEAASQALEALTASVEREDSPLAWWVRAASESNLDKCEEINRQGIARFPDSALLVGALAGFLSTKRGKHDEAESYFTKALSLDPRNSPVAGAYATFLTAVRGRHEEAEHYFQRALEQGTRNATTITNYAAFLAFVRNDSEQADKLFRQSLALKPDGAHERCNFAAFLLQQNRYLEASALVERSWWNEHERATPCAAIVALYRAFIARATGEDDSTQLAELKVILDTGFDRGFWTFREEFPPSKSQLSEEDARLYQSLNQAIHDASHIPQLDRFPRWRAIQGTSSEQDERAE